MRSKFNAIELSPLEKEEFYAASVLDIEDIPIGIHCVIVETKISKELGAMWRRSWHLKVSRGCIISDSNCRFCDWRCEYWLEIKLEEIGFLAFSPFTCWACKKNSLFFKLGCEKLSHIGEKLVRNSLFIAMHFVYCWAKAHMEILVLLSMEESFFFSCVEVAWRVWWHLQWSCAMFSFKGGKLSHIL